MRCNTSRDVWTSFYSMNDDPHVLRIGTSVFSTSYLCRKKVCVHVRSFPPPKRMNLVLCMYIVCMY